MLSLDVNLPAREYRIAHEDAARLGWGNNQAAGSAEDDVPRISKALEAHGLMKSHTEYHTFQTAKHREYINITGKVNEALRKSGIQEGMILVSAMHITAGVWVNDAEDGLIADIDEWL